MSSEFVCRGAFAATAFSVPAFQTSTLWCKDPPPMGFGFIETWPPPALEIGAFAEEAYAEEAYVIETTSTGTGGLWVPIPPV